MRSLSFFGAPLLAAIIILATTPVARADVVVLRSSDAGYVTDLETRGLSNGSLPDEALVGTLGTQGRCLLDVDSAEQWDQLVLDAAVDGVRIEAGSCYRDLAAQRSTYVQNCGSLRAPQSDCNVATATPGRSNHGWGRAIDVTSEGRQIGCRSEAFRWLTSHAAKYGWVHPWWADCGGDTPEPWHWEWGGIEIIPSPVFPIDMRPI